MNVTEVRNKYVQYCGARGHVVIPSASLVPQNDPTTLFTGSGMQPLIPYLLGEQHAKGTRLVNSQKCFRAEDIDEVGDNRHTTFFEMLGNWSLGDYFKSEQLPWFFGFLTDELGIDASRLYVTAFIGDAANNIPKDVESAEIWQKLFATKNVAAEVIDIGSEDDGYRLGMQGGRIFYYNAKKNWWSRSGIPENMPAGEPGGPDSEVFYDFGTPHDPAFGAECHPNCDCGRFLEIGNSVFMQYIKKSDGTFSLLPKQNVDFGGGLERIAAAARGDSDVFKTDVFWDSISLLEHFSNTKYDDSRYQRSYRIIADHMRAAIFMLGDGVRPSNTERGYVLRRLIRRASQHARKLGLSAENQEDSMLVRIGALLIEKYKSAYSELDGEMAYTEIAEEIWKEEVQFARTLESGLRMFEKLSSNGISAEDAYVLFTTYGFPFELTQELAAEHGVSVDIDGFKDLMKKHQDLSRSGSEQKFKGGLADSSERTTRLHTAHHILLKALQTVLGPQVKQRGSNITSERLRIDFSHGAKMSTEQLADVERIVNERISEQLPVVRTTLPKLDAEMLGAEHEFGAKYPDMVSVYSIGPVGASESEPRYSEAYSVEFCGGPHVRNTRELSESGTFKIQKEEAVASGVRRIKATLS